MMTPLGPGFGCGQSFCAFEPKICGDIAPSVPNCIDQFFKCMTCYKMERGLL